MSIEIEYIKKVSEGMKKVIFDIYGINFSYLLIYKLKDLYCFCICKDYNEARTFLRNHYYVTSTSEHNLEYTYTSFKRHYAALPQLYPALIKYKMIPNVKLNG